MCLWGLVKGKRGHLLKCQITAFRISSASCFCSVSSILLTGIWFMLYYSWQCCCRISAHVYKSLKAIFVSHLLQSKPAVTSPPPSFCVSELESGAERAHHIQQIVVTLPRTIIIVMRYLFAFLNQWVRLSRVYILSHRSWCVLMLFSDFKGAVNAVTF